MSNKPTVNISFGMMPLFITFLILKLTETIDWSWWWITAPLWIPFAIAFAVLGLMGILTLGIFILDFLSNIKYRKYR